MTETDGEEPPVSEPTPTPSPAPFATVSDLFVRLGLPTPPNPSTAYNQALTLLDDASHDLRDQIGQRIDRGEHTWSTLVPVGGLVNLPGRPVIEVESVTTAGGAVNWDLLNAAQLQVGAPAGTRITVTYSYGWVNVPRDLKRWTLVLAAASIGAAEAGNLGLSGGIAGIGVDDARVTFATNAGEAGQGVQVPERVLARLRATYGSADMIVEHQP